MPKAIAYASNYDVTIGFSGVAPQLNLIANTPLSYTVPSDQGQTYIVNFAYTANSAVYVANNSTATVPTAGTIDPNSVSEFRPKKRFVRGGDVLSFISPDTSSYVGFSLRVVPR